jgi:hypothetical protein
MKRSILLAASIAAIAVAAGCSGGGGGGPAQMPPGKWEMTTKLTALDAPGAPPEMLAALRGQLNREQTNSTCITQEQASNPLRQMREMMSRGQPGASCTTDDDTWANGVIRVRVTCRGTNGQPGQGTMSMEGTFTADTFNATMTVSGQGMGGGGLQSLNMTQTFRGRRTGDCAAGAAAPVRPGNSL